MVKVRDMEINKLKKEIEILKHTRDEFVEVFKGVSELVDNPNFPRHGEQILIEFRKLKDELEVASSIADLTNATNQENNKLREENKKLKEELNSWRIDDNHNENKLLDACREVMIKLQEENKKLKDEIKDLKFKNNKLEFQLSNPTFDDDYANQIIDDRNEEINKLKEEIDTTFECTGYGDDIIEDGYTKLDAIHDWATGACDCFKEEIERLEEDIDRRSKCAQEEVVRMVRLSGRAYDITKNRKVNLDLMEKEIKKIIEGKD